MKMKAEYPLANMHLIRRMVRQIANHFHPEQVILFGSYARGDAGPDSDVDLLVVMDVPGSKRDKVLEIRAALGKFHVAQDVLISRPSEFAWRKEYPGTVERPAHLEGKVLYARGR